MEKERYYEDNDKKESALYDIKTNILYMINHVEDEGMVIEREISHVTREEIHEYMRYLRYDDSFDIKSKRIWDIELTNLQELAEIYDDMQVYDVKHLDLFPQMGYIIESDRDAILFIPVERINKQITYRIQPLEKSNRYIKERYWERIDRKKNLKRIPFVKL